MRKRKYLLGAVVALCTSMGGLGIAVTSASAAVTHPAVHTQLPPGTIRSVTLNPTTMKNARAAAIAQPGFTATNNKIPVEGANSVYNGDACITSGCGDVTYHSGPIMRHPQFYLLLWGPDWSGESTYTPELQNMMAGLGVENQNQSTSNADKWLATTHQYGDGSTGSPWFYQHGILGAVGSTYATSYIDTSTPPADTTQAQLASEAIAFANTEGIALGHQSAIIIATQQGTCPDQSVGTSCPTPQNFCAFHTYATSGSSNLPYIMLPWAPDEQGGCSPNNQPAEIFSAAAGHEIAEAITSPLENGWNNTGGGEIADECPGYSSVTLGNGDSFTEQELYSNTEADAGSAGTGCTYNSGPIGPLTSNSTTSTICIDNESGTVSNLNPVDMATCSLTTATGEQIWGYDSNAQKELNVQGKCLQDPSDGGTGTAVNIYNCNGSVQEKWTFEPYSGDPGFGQWTVANNGTRCLHRFNNNSTQLDVETCSTSVGNQLWPQVDQINP